jgi:CBS domain-containing protein
MPKPPPKTMLDAMSNPSSMQPGSRGLDGAPSDEICVGEIMHPGVLYCPPEAPLRWAAEMMARHHVHAVVVLGDDEEGGLWGVVSDVDVLEALALHELDEHSAGGMAATPIVTISRSDSVARAAELMREHSVTHLLVVAGKEHPVGVVSTLDLAGAVAAGMVDG